MKEKLTYTLETNVYTDPVTIIIPKGKAGILFGTAEAIADHFQVDDRPTSDWDKDDNLEYLTITGYDGDGDEFELTVTRQK